MFVHTIYKFLEQIRSFSKRASSQTLKRKMKTGNNLRGKKQLSGIRMKKMGERFILRVAN